MDIMVIHDLWISYDLYGLLWSSRLTASLRRWWRPWWPRNCTRRLRFFRRRSDGPRGWDEAIKGGTCEATKSGDLWWFMMIYDDLWWFMMIYDDLWWFMMIYDDLWWFMVIYGDLWWFMVLYDDLWWFIIWLYCDNR